MMDLLPLMSFSNVPFCIGTFDSPSNPEPLPDCMPLQLYLNRDIHGLTTDISPECRKFLDIAYSLGIEMGTPSDDSKLGKQYVIDFLEFINSAVQKKGRALEIGAGVGYISLLLIQDGFQVDSIEPGKGYQKYWDKYKINVINECFPSKNAPGPYDLIIMYTVLEHILDSKSFLETVIAHLAPDGVIVLAVPDCSHEIECGDPAMLLHEHCHYFTKSSLERTLQNAGLKAHVRNSKYGRSLYASAIPSKNIEIDTPSEREIELIGAYPNKVKAMIERINDQVEKAISQGSLGIYCPARALMALPQNAILRFFDDSPLLHGKYYPPFKSKIESQDDLLSDPPDSLWIMSRTFGEQIYNRLKNVLPQTQIQLIANMFP